MTGVKGISIKSMHTSGVSCSSSDTDIMLSLAMEFTTMFEISVHNVFSRCLTN